MYTTHEILHRCVLHRVSEYDHYIALEFIATLSAFPDGSSCFALFMLSPLDLIFVITVLFREFYS